MRALVLEPGRLDVREHLAGAYLLLGRDDSAILEYQKIARCAPENAEIHLEIGRLLLAKGSPEDALTDLRLAVRYRPESAPARAALSEAERLIQKR